MKEKVKTVHKELVVYLKDKKKISIDYPIKIKIKKYIHKILKLSKKINDFIYFYS
jgi:hypothetical protein